MKYDKNKNTSLLSAPISIKYLTEETKFLCSFIAPCFEEGDCSNTGKFVAHHFANGISQIQCIDFDQSYSTVAHEYSFRINIDIADMNRLTDRILDSSNAF